MKKYLSLLICILLLIVGVPEIGADTETLQLNTLDTNCCSIHSGTTLYVGGNGSGNYSTIQRALSVANDGDTIYVYAGIYFENIVIRNAVTLQGEEKNTTIIDGGGEKSVITLSANSITITEFTIQNGYYHGIYSLEETDDTIIHQNIIRFNHVSGLKIMGFPPSDRNTISDNVFYNNECGIHIGDIFSGSHRNNKIVGNRIEANRKQGIHLEACWRTKIQGNRIEANKKQGIHLEACKSTKIQGNTFLSNEAGILVTGGWLNAITKNTFLNNTLEASFRTSLLNIWSQNYWGQPQTHPFIIWGKIGKIPWIKVDWRPAQEPY